MSDIGRIIERPLPSHPDNEILKTIGRLDWLKFPGSDSHAAWIAGGSVLKLAMGHTVFGDSDLDVFLFDCDRKLDIGVLLTQDQKITHYSDNLNTVQYKYLAKEFPSIHYETIQVILRRSFDSLESLFNDFDFTCCMFATDGKTIAGPQQAWDDLESKTLRLHYSNEGRKTIMRVKKYTALGFEPAPGLMSKLFENLSGFEIDKKSGCIRNDDVNY